MVPPLARPGASPAGAPRAGTRLDMHSTHRSWVLNALALRRLSLASRCVIAAGAVLATFLLRVAIIGWQPGSAYLPFLPVVMLSTLLLGLLPGLVAAGLGWLSSVIWFVPPVGGLAIEDWQDLAFAVFFPAAAAFAAVMVEVFLAASGIEDDL